MCRLIAGVAISLALLLPALSFAQSQSPPATPTDSSQPPKTEAGGFNQLAPESKGNAAARLRVPKAGPAAKAPDERNKEPAIAWWTVVQDNSIIVFTAVLAWSTIFLTYWTYRLVRHTANSERAYVKMSHQSPPGLDIDRERGEVRIVIQVKNFGRTPADVTDVLLCWLILPKADRLPAAPTYPPPENPDTPTSEFLVADDSFLYWKTFDGISDNHFAGIKAGIETLWIYGYVDYIDKFQERHRGGYARVYEPGRGAGPPEQRNNLIFVSQRNYNYDRRRKKGEGNDW